MAIDVQELAVVMGVDNPDRVFKKHPVKAAQRARMFELFKELFVRSSDDEATCDALDKLSVNCLPTILRAQVEAKFGDKWESVASFLISGPSYARFVREHAYASTWYEWLVRTSERTMPTWRELRDGITYSESGAELTPNVGLSRSAFSDAATGLCYTIFYAAALPYPESFIFPASLADSQASLADKLERTYFQWDRAGRPEPPGESTFANMFICGHVVNMVFVKEMTIREALDGRGCLQGQDWSTCGVSVEGLAPPEGCVGGALRACSRCKCVRYCCAAYQKLAWPTHRKKCFAPKW